MNKISIFILFVSYLLLLISWPLALGIEKNEAIKLFMDTSGLMGVFLTFIAAFIGVVGAQYIVEYYQSRKEIIKELRAINTALMLSKISINALLNHKAVFLNFLQRYEEKKERVHSLIHEGIKPNIALDIVEIKAPDIDLFQLKEIVYTHIYASKDEVFYASRLAISERKMLDEISQFNRVMAEINELANTGEENNFKAFRSYFNLKYGPHNVGDERLESGFYAILEVTDTALHHLCRLGEHLYSRANKMNYTYNRKLSLVSFDRNLFNTTNLMPNFEEFENYEELF